MGGPPLVQAWLGHVGRDCSRFCRAYCPENPAFLARIRPQCWGHAPSCREPSCNVRRSPHLLRSGAKSRSCWMRSDNAAPFAGIDASAIYKRDGAKPSLLLQRIQRIWIQPKKSRSGLCPGLGGQNHQLYQGLQKFFAWDHEALFTFLFTFVTGKCAAMHAGNRVNGPSPALYSRFGHASKSGGGAAKWRRSHAHKNPRCCQKSLRNSFRILPFNVQNKRFANNNF